VASEKLIWQAHRVQRSPRSYRLGMFLYRDCMLVVLATLAGFTASGILANIYRIIAKKPEGVVGRVSYFIVMTVAGPNVMFENAATALRAKKSSAIAFWFTVALTSYWSFTIGLLIIAACLALSRH